MKKFRNDEVIFVVNKNIISAPPGPIENHRISYTKSGQIYLRQNSDHGQLTEETWKFLHSKSSESSLLAVILVFDFEHILRMHVLGVLFSARDIWWGSRTLH